jgi:hypothetical protein
MIDSSINDLRPHSSRNLNNRSDKKQNKFGSKALKGQDFSESEEVEMSDDYRSI